MRNVTVYGLLQCDTCRKAIKWLEADHVVDFIDIRTSPPTEVVLRQMVEQSELDIQKFFNVSGQLYRDKQMKSLLPDLTTQQKIAILASEGMLIKRPLVTDGKRTTVGYKSEMFEQVWKKSEAEGG